ncbi:MAG: PD-(D/E)XK nuclease family transposase [Lachnospiraceae bacterium]|nr:PD-(D/E)XK nuclease family transposase [Lachnospiraceae bacterium]
MKKKSISVSNIFGDPRSSEDVLYDIHSDPKTLDLFNSFSEADRERIMLFLEGKHSLQILNDVFFQKVMRPYPPYDRIESLLSAILGEPVKVEANLPREGSRISETGSQVVMDIIVKLRDQSITTIEMQRIGYLFPGERTNCYLADMIMRQYNELRPRRGGDFSYKDMRPVRLIIFMERSSAEFKAVAPEYIHTREISYSTGAGINDLENVVYFSLDTYRDLPHNEINTKLDAWLSFFSYEDPEHVIALIDRYPEFLPLYQDIAALRSTPEEVMGMFSEALRIMDRNTTKYMIDELNQELADKDKALAEKDQALADKDQALSELSSENTLFRELLEANGITVPAKQ